VIPLLFQINGQLDYSEHARKNIGLSCSYSRDAVFFWDFCFFAGRKSELYFYVLIIFTLYANSELLLLAKEFFSSMFSISTVDETLHVLSFLSTMWLH
jgi:hypothetical protein